MSYLYVRFARNNAKLRRSLQHELETSGSLNYIEQYNYVTFIKH
jgi:hypothetical protein